MSTEFKNVVLDGQTLDNYFISKTGIVKNAKGIVLKQTRPGYVMLSVKGKRKHVKIVELIVYTFGVPKNTEVETDKRHYYSSNKSYLKMVDILDKMEVENKSVHCRVTNPTVIGLDPFSNELTEDEKDIIIEECSNNIFYFIGECLRIPGDLGIERFELDIANLSAIWAFDNNISSYSALPVYPGRKFSQFAIAVWLILFRDLSISYVTKIDVNDYSIKLLKMIDYLPDFIKDINKVKNADLRLINNHNSRSYTNRDVVLIDDFENIPDSNKIIPTDGDTLISINTLVGDPDEIGFDPMSLISKMLKWNIEFLDLSEDEVQNLQGRMIYIEYQINALVPNVEKYCMDFIKRYKYDQNITDRVLFLRRKTQVDDRKMETVFKDAKLLEQASKIINTCEPGGYVDSVIQDAISQFTLKNIDLNEDMSAMIKLATVYNIIKNIDLDNLNVDMTEEYGSFEEFAIKTFGIIDEDEINNLGHDNDKIYFKLAGALHSITGEYYINLYPNIRRLYDTMVETQEAFKKFPN